MGAGRGEREAARGRGAELRLISDHFQRQSNSLRLPDCFANLTLTILGFDFRPILIGVGRFGRRVEDVFIPTCTVSF